MALKNHNLIDYTQVKSQKYKIEVIDIEHALINFKKSVSNLILE